jgi:hypothetical protein
MNREQMIAWLTLEGWEYYYWPPDASSEVGVDGFAREGKRYYIGIDRRNLDVDCVEVPDGCATGVRCNLPTADIAVAVEFLEKLS